MERRREVDRDTRRKIFTRFGLSYILLIPLGLQIYFDYEHDRVGQTVMTIIVLAYLVAVCVWIWRNRTIFRQLRRRQARSGRNR